MIVDDMLLFAKALRDNKVPVPEIAKKLVIKTGKNKGTHPSVASLYRPSPTRASPRNPPNSPNTARAGRHRLEINYLAPGREILNNAPRRRVTRPTYFTVGKMHT